MPKVTLVIAARDAFSVTLGQASKAVQSVVSSAARATAVAAGALAGAMAGAVAIGRVMVREWQNSERAADRLRNVLTQTGGAAGWTSAQLRKQASELQRLTGYSDDAVAGIQTLLAAQRTIKGDEFRRATVAALDMAEAMTKAGQSEGDIEGQARALATALADPAQGMARLRRAGIIFTDQQKRMAEQMQAAGNIAGAQRLILDQLEAQYGGVASSGNQTILTMRVLGQTVGDLKERIGEAISNSSTFRQALAAVLSAVQGLIDGGRVDLWANRIEGAFREVMPWAVKIAGVFGKIGNAVQSVGAFAGGLWGGASVKEAATLAGTATEDTAATEKDQIAELVKERAKAARERERLEAAEVAKTRRRLREQQMAELTDREQALAESVDRMNLQAIIHVSAATDAASVDEALASARDKAGEIMVALSASARAAQEDQRKAVAEIQDAEAAAESARAEIDRLGTDGSARLTELRKAAEAAARAVAMPKTKAGAERVEQSLRSEAETQAALELRQGDIMPGSDNYLGMLRERTDAIMAQVTMQQRLDRADRIGAKDRQTEDQRRQAAQTAAAALAAAEAAERERIAEIGRQETGMADNLRKAEAAAAKQAKARKREQDLAELIKQADEYGKKLDEATRKRLVEIEVSDLNAQIAALEASAKKALRLDVVDPREEAAGFAERGKRMERIAKESAEDQARQARLERQQGLAERGLAAPLTRRSSEWLAGQQEWQGAQQQAAGFAAEAAALEAQRDMVQNQQLAELQAIHKVLAGKIEDGEL